MPYIRLQYEGGKVRDKYLCDIDEFLKADHGTAFDRAHFARRKQCERRMLSGEPMEIGHTIRSGKDRRVFSDRRRGWKRNLSGKMNVESWET